MTTRKANLTQAVAEAAKKGEIIRDTTIRGFYLKGHDSGAKSWMYAFRLKDGQRRHPCLGHFPQLTAAEARKKAGDFQNMRNNGVDPTAQFQALRTSPTLRDVFMPAVRPADGLSYKHSWLDRRIGKKSLEIYEAVWRCHTAPALGDRRVVDISKADILRVYELLRGRGKTQAHNFIVHMQPFFDWCEAKGLRPKGSNPVRAAKEAGEIDKAPHLIRRKHPISDAQFMRIMDELAVHDATHPGRFQATAIRILMMTGLRRSEIAAVERSWVDLVSRVINLPHTKSGRVASGDPGARVVHISEEVVEIIRDIYAKRPDSKWLIPGPKDRVERHGRDGRLLQRGGDFPDLHLYNAWSTIRERAGVPKLTIHGLRHYFVIRQLNNGEPLPDVSKMIGHKNIKITAQVYADVLDEAHPETVARAQNFMSDLMKRRPAEIVAFPEKKTG